MGANTSDADLLQGLGRGRGRGASLLIKQSPNEAGSVVWGDLFFDAPTGGAYTLTAEAGSYALTGVAASIVKGYSLNAEAGSFTLTGVAAGIVKGYALDANAGSYTLSGFNASLIKGFVLNADAGGYSLSGSDASIVRGYQLTCDAGSYSVSGGDADIVFGAETAPSTANQWYGFLTAYELLNKKKKRQVFDAEAEVEELLVEIPKTEPKADDLEAQKLLRAVKRKAERDGKAAADAFVAKLIAQSQARMLAEQQASEIQRQLAIEIEEIRLRRLQDEEEAILLLF